MNPRYDKKPIERSKYIQIYNYLERDEERERERKKEGKE